LEMTLVKTLTWASPRAIILRLIVGFHLIAIVSWSLPSAPAEIKRQIVKPSSASWLRNWSAHFLHWNDRNLKRVFIEPYLRTVGAQQNWNMFAPNPITHDLWVDAEVTFLDGSTERYLFPRSSKMSVAERFIKERYRKYIETVHQESSGIIWPALADYVARQVYNNPENPPVAVKLFRHMRFVAAPGEMQNADFNEFLFFETPILLERLEVL